MLTQDAIIIATPIGLATNKDLHEAVGPVIQGLNYAVGNLASYDVDKLAVDVPDYTNLVTEHTLFADTATTQIAGAIRQAYGIISKHVKPICSAIDRAFQSESVSQLAADTIFAWLNVSMYNIEPSFFSSIYYPSKIPATMEGITSIRFEDFLRGAWPELTGKEIYDLVYADVPEIIDLICDTDELKTIYDAIFIRRDAGTIFNYADHNFELGTVNLATGGSVNNFRALMVTYLILCRLATQDDPLAGFSGSTLDEYRSTVILSRDFLTKALINFKTVWEDRARAGLVIDYSGTKYGELSERNDPYSHWVKGMPVLTGQVRVGYSRSVLEMFALNDKLSLSDFVAGMCLCYHKGIQIKDVVTDAERITNEYQNYVDAVFIAMRNQFGSIARGIATREITEAYKNNEEFKMLVDAACEDKSIAVDPIAIISKHIALEDFFIYYTGYNNRSLMETDFGVAICKLLGSGIAAEIIEGMAGITSKDIGEYRTRLSEAAAKMIIKRLFNK